MKTLSIVAIALIVLGVVTLAYQGITYTTREKVVDLGPIQVMADKPHTIPLHPVLGIVAVVAGTGILVAGAMKRN